jgi:hypothetical protein
MLSIVYEYGRNAAVIILIVIPISTRKQNISI